MKSDFWRLNEANPNKHDETGPIYINPDIIITDKVELTEIVIDPEMLLENDKIGIVIEPENEEMGMIHAGFEEGLTLIKINNRWGVVDKNKKIVIPPQYDIIETLCRNLLRVQLNGKYGIIDTAYNIVLPIIYDEVGDFFHGLAKVELNGKYGYIDKNFNVVIQLQYDYAEDFEYNYDQYKVLAKVECDGEKFYIDKTGDMVLYIGFEDYDPSDSRILNFHSTLMSKA